MKTILLLIVSLAGIVSVFADDASSPSPSTLPSAKEIVQIKAQELSRVFVQLTLQEIDAQHAIPADNDKLALIRAQKKAINQELLNLILAPLELELQHYTSKGMLPGHVKMIELKKRIEDTKAILAGMD